MENKVVLVVGSTSGIGKAMAETFAKEGAIAIVTGRREELGKEIVNDIVAKGGKADFFKLDATSLEECVNLIDAVVEKHGHLDSLVYNAGIAWQISADISSADAWDTVMNTNLKSAFYMIQKALPELAKVKGSIVVTSSLAGHHPKTTANETGVAYAASKAGLSHMIKLLAHQQGKAGVRVNAVAPGVTMTDIIRRLDERKLEYLKAGIPLHMIGEPEDIAEAALFLASDKARFITGQVLLVDGGASI